MAKKNRGKRKIDPTANVISLVKANAKSAKDLRKADHRFNVAQDKHSREIGNLRAKNAEIIRKSDLERLDKTRQVDVLAQANSAAGLATAVQTLAKQTTDIGVTLSGQMDNRFKGIDTVVAELNKSMYTGTGRSSVTDPAMEKLLVAVDKLSATSTTRGGESKGMEKVWAFIIAGASIFISFAGLLTLLLTGHIK